MKFEIDQPDLESGEFRISYECIRAYRRGKPLKLRPKELQLLEAFLHNRGKILTREYLANHLAEGGAIDQKTIDVHIMRLRKNLRLRRWRNPISTIRDMGYKLD
jgi:two-component system phosphate regulon response regulator PhoB